jgi:uncharacterized protein
MTAPRLHPQNNAAELDAFQHCCERLSGFDDVLQWEYVDGWLSGLASGPALPPTEDWLPALCGDTFDRVFADPADRAQALRALKTRLAVLREQLDPETLLDDPDALQLDPLLMDWDDAARAAMAEDGAPPEVLALCQPGLVWALGAVAGVLHSITHAATLGVPEPARLRLAQALDAPAAAPLPADGPVDDEAALLALWAVPLVALTHGADSADWQAYVQAFHDGQAPDRDDVLADALLTLQDLRLWWTDQIPVPETRRAAPTPGRNDPCPCGSGRKYKKCHGAA